MLENGKILDFKGGYQEFLAYRERQKVYQQAAAAQVPKTEQAKKEKPKRPGGTKNLEKELSAVERAITKAEEAIQQLDAQMEEAASDYVRLQELCEQKELCEADLLELYNKWETVSAQLEEARG